MSRFTTLLATDPAHPIVKDVSATVLRIVSLVAIVGGIATSALMRLMAPEQTLRAITPLVAVLLFGWIWLLARRGRLYQATIALMVGSWAAITVICVFAAGVRSPIVIMYPVLVIYAGWRLGPKAAAAMAGFVFLALAAMGLAETVGYLRPLPTAPSVYVLVQLMVVAVALALVAGALRAQERRIAEIEGLGRELVASQQDLVRAQAVGHIGSWVFDLDRKSVQLSSETCRILGLPPGSSGDIETYLERIHEADREAFALAWRGAFDSGNFDHEHRVRIGDAIRWIRQKAQLEREADGRVHTVLGVVQDITERKHFETEILAARNQLQATLDAIPDLMFELDLDGRYHEFHSPQVELLAAPPEQLKGRTVAEVLPPEAAAVCLAALREADRIGYSHGRQFALPLPLGVRWFELSVARKAVAADETPRFVMLSRDITERKAIEQTLQNQQQRLEQQVAQRTGELAAARDAAEAASLAKSAFLANISHEIRTPMNAIVGLSFLLRRAEANPAQVERLVKIDAAAQQLLGIINDILDVSRSEAGLLVSEQFDFSLTELLEKLREQVAGPAAAKGLVLEIDAEGVPVWLRGDPARLRQALFNCVGNAIKFTERGRIDVRVRLIEEGSDGVHLRFEIEDTGIGIAADKLPTLFRPFEQVDSSMTRRHGGAGLGLAITRRLAERMGGEVGADSTPGAGSCFWFTARLQRGRDAMPATDATGVGAGLAAETELRRRAGGARLLLVDDNLINREVALELLQSAGLATEVAEDGVEALAMARTAAYDLILMDLQMPRMGGIAATRAIRALPGHRRTPILAMTANALAEDRRDCSAAGMNDFVAKPVRPEQLYATLAKWLPVVPDAVPASVSSLVSPADPALLPPIEGLDLTRGLGLLRGNVGTYRRILGMFASSHGRDAERILAARQAGDRVVVRGIAHGLKGSAGSIGALSIAHAATELDAALRAEEGEEQIDVLSRKLVIELDRVIGGVSEVLARESGPPRH